MRFPYLHILAVMAVLTVSCESSDPDVTSGDGYTIHVDRTVIQADGNDMALFTIKDPSGKVVSTDSEAGVIYYENVRTGTRLARRSKGFTAMDNGEYEFVGIYRGTYTSNTVKITAVNRGKYEKFHRNVAIFKLTGAWCPACPGMTEALHELDEDVQKHVIVLACHYNDIYSGVGLGEALSYDFENNSFPANIYDLYMLDRSVGDIASIVNERRTDSPATCGIRVSGFTCGDGNLKVETSMTSSEGGVYDLACAILKDNNYLAYDGRTSYAPDGYYHDVVWAASENIRAFKGSTSVTLEKDGQADRTFTFAYGGNEDMLDDLKVVVFAHRKDKDGETSVDNAVLCRFGETKDYIYNE